MNMFDIKIKAKHILFWHLLKMLSLRFSVLVCGFLFLSFFLDAVSNISKLPDGAHILNFLGFTFSKSIKIISETMPLVALIAFIWLFVSLNSSGQIRSCMSFGLEPFEIMKSGMLFCTGCMFLYLFVLQSSFVKVLNYAEQDFTDAIFYKKILNKKYNNISLVKDSSGSLSIFYLTNAYYKKTFDGGKTVVFADQIDLITYNTSLNQQSARNINDWQVIKNVSLMSNGILGGVVLKSKDNNGSGGRLLDIDFQLIINKIDAANLDLFAFSFASLPFKIFKLKKQNLSYGLFEQQFYARISNGLLFCLSLLIPMFFLFNLPKRSVSVVAKIIYCIFSFFICFIVCYSLSSFAKTLTSGYYIALFNLLPISLMVTMFFYLNLQKHC